MRKIFILNWIIVVLLSACSSEGESENPAEKQIADYTKQLEDCQEENQENAKSQEGKSVEELKQMAKENGELASGGEFGAGGSSKNENSRSEEEGNKNEGQGKNASKEAESRERAKNKKFKKSEFQIKSTDMFLGDADSKVVIVEYFSFTCPHCNAFLKRTYPKIKEKYIDTGEVAYVFREFIASKQDLYASILARCKGDAESYMGFLKALMTQQDTWAFNKNFQELLTNIALLGGVSAEEYSACIDDEPLNKLLIDNTKIPTKVPGFVGTPAFFINGSHFTKPYTFEELSNAIDEEIAKNK